MLNMIRASQAQARDELARVRMAAEAHRRLREQAHQAHKMLVIAMADAAAAGQTRRAIAGAAGITAGRVQQLLGTVRGANAEADPLDIAAQAKT